MKKNLNLFVAPLNPRTYPAYAQAASRRAYALEPTGEGLAVFTGDTFVAGISLHPTQGAFLVLEDLVGDVPTDHLGRRTLHRAVRMLLEASVASAMSRNLIPIAVVPFRRPALLRAVRAAGLSIRQGIPVFAYPSMREPLSESFGVPVKPKRRSKK